jgi:tetratricopeptide (TPR) repeat protein
MVKLSNWLKENYPYLIALTLLVGVAYFNSLGNGFVADDVPEILNNPDLTKVNHIFSGLPVFVRPFLYFLTGNLFGKSPTAFRLVNILFHLGSVGLTYALVSLLIDSTVGFFAAALLAVHPLETEAVAWISGGAHSFYGFFALLGLTLYLLVRRNPKFLPFWIGGLTLTFISSEMAMFFPLILLVFSFASQTLRQDWKKLIPPLILALVWGLLSAGRIGLRATTIQAEQPQAAHFYNPLLQIPIAITSYLELIFWPKNLTLYHSEMTFSSVEYYSRVLVFLIFLGLIVYALKKNRTVFFWLSFFLLALLPTLNPLGISWIVAERYAYLGAVGIFVVIAVTVNTIIEKIEFSLRLDRTVIFYVILGLLLTPLTVRTIARNNDWKNQDTLWLATAKTSPSSPQNHNNLGDLYGRRGDLERSAAEFQKAIELNPEYADAYHNLGNTYWQMGEIEEAIECFRKAAELKPSLWQSCQNLAAIYFEQGNLTAAKDWMEKAVAANPTDPNLQRNLEIINAQLSSPE